MYYATNLEAIAALSTNAFGRSLLTKNNAAEVFAALGLSSGGMTSYSPTPSATGGTIGSATVNSAKYQLINTKLCYLAVDITINNAGTASRQGLNVNMPFNATGLFYGLGRELAVNGFGQVASTSPGSSTLAIVKNDFTANIVTGARITASILFEVA
ncbi:hypothetical protein [Methylobacterium gnaphalii]|uniref:Uncharacterized protein n=1 Tax=Methylobacterium gnaphalii TaxID=1010610 RepID=A0A512JNC5_9HYPH|nr:hypothetical protein [Methylobacterium gnaphalii]GEP11442.1 hypothetical protein MGN01_32870 [Methylobacterium gnaphalii]GJD70216.1 hypothetical protein MMMDOFMJ_3158 [Methylobacterium gnaphalii]GLS50547.1 hypothetical protein GCM10007885_33990 [Methylobacterium gnaphalii]